MSSGPPPGVTPLEWRKFQAKKLRAEMKANGPQPSGARSLSGAASLDSAALQADMSRRFNLSTAAPRRPTMNSAETKQSTQSQNAVTLLRQQERQQKRAYKEFQAAQQQSVAVAAGHESAPKEKLPDQYCDSCDALNRGADAVCIACGYFLAGAPAPAPETLAQRRGLAPKAAPKAAAVTSMEWMAMETVLTRRDDAFCPICMDGFKQGTEVLLSCTHMFHRACLAAFEKFMGREGRSCPICRTSNYQKKITSVGSASFQKVCVLKIQCVFRGYLARKEFRVKLRGFYRAGGFGSSKYSNMARRTFFEKELSSLGTELEVNVNARVRGLNSVVAGIDRTLCEGRDLDVLFDSMLRQRQATRDALGISEPEAMGSADDITSGVESAVDADEGSEGGSNTQAVPQLTETQWLDVLKIARNRGLGECAICMAPNKGLRNICMLSCSHIFHTQCMFNFEKFVSESENRGCPICRANFSSRPIATGGVDWGLSERP